MASWHRAGTWLSVPCAKEMSVQQQRVSISMVTFPINTYLQMLLKQLDEDDDGVQSKWDVKRGEDPVLKSDWAREVTCMQIK